MNHASVVVDYDGLRLISDPWLEGAAFNNGWELVSETRFQYQDFADITHIWFSHEHPDHFSPPNLKKIPAEVRAGITVLFRRTRDKKVAKFCAGLGFKQVVELQPTEWLRLSPSVEVLCQPWTDLDSWMAIRTDHGTILNINDCVIRAEEDARRIGAATGPINAMLTQFSYAQWSGNPNDKNVRRDEAKRKLAWIGAQVRALDPGFVIPFASHVWFCHDENYYLNDAMNDVGEVAEFIDRELGRQPIVLYPGDWWELGAAHDWARASALFRHDVARRLENGPTHHAKPIALDQVVKAADIFLDRLQKRNPWVRLQALPKTSVHLVDCNQTFALSIRDGFRAIQDEQPADISTTAENLLYCFRYDWGANTLHVNGRFTVPPGGDHLRFMRFFHVSNLNNHGYYIGRKYYTDKLWRRGRRLLTGKQQWS